jgi:hypothetical protein
MTPGDSPSAGDRFGLRRTPPPLWVYGVLSLGGSFVYAALEFSEHSIAAIGTVVLAPVVTFYVLRGNRLLWSFSTLSVAATLLGSPFAEQRWWTIALEIVALGCLLAPASQRFVWRTGLTPTPPPAPAAISEKGAPQTSLDPTDFPDSDRPSGWYIDPSTPRRMRYWSGEAADWRGATRTPRRIKKAWTASTARANTSKPNAPNPGR